MSSLQRGVLRAVRLMTDVVKIGVEPGTALPSTQKGEQLLNERQLSDIPDSREEPKEETNQAPAIEPLKELQTLIDALSGQLNEAKTKEQGSMEKINALEAELSAVKSASIQKERELTDSVIAAKEQARTEGRNEGWGEGLQKGYDDGLHKAKTEVEGQYREKFSSLVAALEGVSTSIEEQFAELVALNQPRMLRLWHSMLKRMLHHEITLAPDGIFDVLADVLSRLSDKNHVLIYVSPEDLELLENKLEGEFGEILRSVKRLELKPDAHVDKGSCIVETNLGVYDARWRTQFDQIDTVVENLFQKLGKAPQAKPKDKRARAGGKNAEAGAEDA